MAASGTLHPEVLWAQRPDRLLITINLTDINGEKVDLQPTRIVFNGVSGGKNYAADIELYAEVTKEGSTVAKTARGIHMVVKKKEQDQPYWPRLQKEKVKTPFIKTDFDQWKDEDESSDEEDQQNAGAPGGFPGLGGMDFSQFQGAGGDFNFDDMDDGGSDDDEGDDGKDAETAKAN
ncbi:HSP20-like chaperone [Thamnocephalis sphaerospora]|uniref:HSP20-like chaperone n=1 Tax=Thamnocephalis sphaerospora TaxID=78915 RepID=A0A4P9XVF4_9FUNG|nr:HSP20-like chaperone [Thamnocephalis sphaerospora]|eukprot:RKP09992.1 HSP20-like chaperone [Thamnocephalis sphaerospora]